MIKTTSLLTVLLFASPILPRATAAPVVTSAPAPTLNLFAGASPVLLVTATGSGNLTYTWKRNGDPIPGNATAGTAALSLPNASANASGSYQVNITDSTGTTTAGPFLLNLTDPAASDAYAIRILGDGPSHYWRMNEASGTVLTDYAGGLNGTVNPTRVERNQPATTGLTPDPATRFKAAAGVSASVPYSPLLNGDTPFTIEFWVKPDFSGTKGTALLSTQDRNNGRAGYVFYQGSAGNFWDVQIGTGNSFQSLNSGNVVPLAGRWDHLVLTWGGESGTANFYVNGVLRSTRPAILRTNQTQPLEFGSRFGGGLPFAGTLDEVAFYPAELSVEQVLNHYAATYQAPSVTTHPVPVNATEASTFTLSATIAGFPNTYQWKRNGIPLEPTEGTPYGTLKYPGGVTGTTLTILDAMTSDSGQYTLEASNALGTAETNPVSISVAPDLTPPTVSYVTASPVVGRIRIGFSKEMDPNLFNNTAFFQFTGGLTPIGIFPTNDLRVIDLVTAGMVPGGNYSLRITGLRDNRVNRNLIAPNQTAFQAFVLTPGVLAWDHYTDIPGNQVSILQVDAQFPDGVWTHRFLQGFSTLQVTKTDLATNPAFGNDIRTGRVPGEQYGARLHGWITPRETANYLFYLRSDDGGELSLSTDDAQGNLSVIISGSGAIFNDTNKSLPIPLVAGQPYFIEALHKEAGGADYLEVAWRKTTDVTPVASLAPIPSRFLSAYAPILQGLDKPSPAGDQLTLTWPGPGFLQESSNLTSWSDVAGFPASGYTLPVPPGTSRKFYRLRQ